MSDFAYPNDPKNLVIRPLLRGMMRHLAANQIPAEAGWTLQDIGVFRGGMQTRPRYIEEFAADPTAGDDLMRTMFLHWEDTESFQTMVLGDRFIYSAIGGQITRIPWDTYTGVADIVSAGGQQFTLADDSATFITDGYKLGDILTIDGARCRLETVESETEIIVTVLNGVVSAGTDQDFTIEKAFNGGELYPIQYARMAGTVGRTYFGGARGRGVVKYTIDGGYEEVDLFPDTETEITDIRSIEVIGNRLYVGNFNEDGVERTNRIRWGNAYPSDPEVFDSGDYGFFDFLEARTGLVRLKKMGALAVAYFGDEIYFGRPTNIAGLPYEFTKMDTGGVGLAGPRALAEWTDGHFFVGPDDIYYFAPSGPPQPIGSPVVKQTIQAYESTLHLAQAMPDTKRDRILFIFPNSTGVASEMWAYNYKDQAWSYETVLAHGMGFTAVSQGFPFSDYPPVYIDPETYDPSAIADDESGNAIDDLPGLIDDYKASYSKRKLFLLYQNAAYRVVDSDTASCELSAIVPVYESGDQDFGEPDQIKTITRLNVKLENIWEVTLNTIDPDTLELVQDEDTNLIIKVEWSVNRGRTWKNAGNLRIVPGSDEGKVNFLATGSIFRYRLSFTSRAKPVKIVEVGLRAKMRSREVTYG